MELRLPTYQEVYRRNPKNGKFLKGHIPHNKGKKALEYMSEEKLAKMKEKLNEYRKGNKNLWKYNCKKVACFRDGEFIGIFSSSVEAGKVLGVQPRNIRKVCAGERKTAGGYEWKWEEDL